MFLHSEQWRDFQERAGRTTHALGAGNYAVRMDIGVGKHYWYSPCAESAEALVALARESGAVFVKCEPMSENVSIGQELIQKGFSRVAKALQPQRTRIVTLTDEETMLAGMHPKTRYNIRLAQKRGVVVERTDTLDEFMTLMGETTQRDKFHAHAAGYYDELLKSEGVFLYVASVANEPAAAAIVLRHEKKGVYLHGASAHARRADMAPFALHWAIMKELVQEGALEYDLWGVDEKKWPGVTRFKAGFGGREVSYVGSYDYALQKMWYRAYRIKSNLR